MPDTVMDYMMTVQPKYKKSPTEGPYNHSWLVGDEQSLNRAAQGEIDDMLEIILPQAKDMGNMREILKTACRKCRLWVIRC